MNINQLSVRSMLIAMTALVLLAMLALSGVGLLNTQRLESALIQVSDTGQAVRRQMDADMMHDAIRSDVLAALLAAREGNAEKIQEIQRDLANHSERLKQNIETNAKSDLGATVKVQAETTQPILTR